MTFDIRHILRIRAERIRGAVIGILLMVVDEMLSPLTSGARYELPFFFSFYTKPIYVPTQFLWEWIFVILLIIMVIF